MRLHALTAVAVACILAAPGGAGQNPPKKDQLKEEKKKLQGTWTAVAVERDGQAVPEDEVRQVGLRLVFEGDKFHARDAADKLLEEGTYQVDPAKKPRTINFIIKLGNAKELTQYGIYEVKGDSLKVCFARPGKVRPTGFVTKGNNGHRITVFKRAKE
jgi:uncharacterized protein (TIGR03067 family)